MIFRTKVDISKAPWTIGYQDKIAMLGSCFSDNIARKMSEFYFQVTCNPTGTLYNPVSIAHHIDDVAPDADVIIITFGTAWVYVDKKLSAVSNQWSAVVDNCQKRPAADFIRRRLNVEEIVDLWLPIIERYSTKRFIFTVSPIRHIKDGLHENTLSKSILLLAVEKLLSNQKSEVTNRQSPIYFPSYEILLDELRDYRFYSDDMLHPSPVAIAYIWQQFMDTFISADTQREMEKLRALWLNRNHRSLHPGSPEDEAFRIKTEAELHQLQSRYPWIE